MEGGGGGLDRIPLLIKIITGNDFLMFNIKNENKVTCIHFYTNYIALNTGALYA
jgi:hypothetical protein